MPIETEKKFRLSKRQRDQILLRLPQLGAKREGDEFEVNTLYEGESIDLRRCVLRLRRAGDRATLTFKERLPSASDVKQQQEDETTIGNPEAMESILDALGFMPAMIYEKRRETWRLGATEVVIDELPFGLFMEIEGTEKDIRDIENRLAVKGLKAESATYPRLAREHGINRGGVIESRFKK